MRARPKTPAYANHRVPSAATLAGPRSPAVRLNGHPCATSTCGIATASALRSSVPATPGERFGAAILFDGVAGRSRSAVKPATVIRIDAASVAAASTQDPDVNCVRMMLSRYWNDGTVASLESDAAADYRFILA